jgi:hypothetical protein
MYTIFGSCVARPITKELSIFDQRRHLQSKEVFPEIYQS